MKGDTLRIAVVGDGPTAWLAARALAATLGRRPGCVQVLADEHDPTAAEAVALPPAPETWAVALSLDDGQLVNRALGAFSFGAALSGWDVENGAGATWFQPFSTFGAPIGPVGFYPIVLRLREAGADLRLADYSLAALAAQANRFERPGPEARSVLSTCRYGLHADGEGLRDVLRDEAVALGVEVVEGELLGLERDDDGGITALRLDEDRSLPVDLVVDATGPGARIAARADAGRREDWSRWLPARRRFRAAHRTLGTPPAYRHLERVSGGWVEHLPLHGVGQLTAYAGDDEDGEAWRSRLTELAGREAFDTFEEAACHPGRTAQPWTGNCVALGAAAVDLEPLGGGALHFARTALQRLLRLLPGGGELEAVRREFNRQVGLELDHARDFVIAHHYLSGRTPKQALAESRTLPDRLAHRLEVFAARGTVALGDEEPYEPEAWLALFDTAGIVPRHAGPLVAGLDTKTLVAHADKVRAFMLGALKTMPSHEDTLVSLHVADGELESTIESVSLAPPRRGETTAGGH